MKFDVIVGNPPYQLNCASENSSESNAAFASAIYPLFVKQACALMPRHLVMITPSRWMTRTGQGIPDEWVDEMLKGNHFVALHDFQDSQECFAGVDIMGGVNYFHYCSSYTGPCCFVQHTNSTTEKVEDFLDPFSAGIVIRDLKARCVLRKVVESEGLYYKNKSFAQLVSPGHFHDKAGLLSTNWRGYHTKKSGAYNIKYYLNKRLEDSGYAWVSMADIPKNSQTVDWHKIYIPKANGSSGVNAPILGEPFYAEPGSVCSQTYLTICYDQQKKQYSKQECLNIVSYIKCRFFRFMVSIKKKTQDAPSSVYQFVPMQDFSKPWTDAELYAKYKLTKDEIAFIESMIKPME